MFQNQCKLILELQYKSFDCIYISINLNLSQRFQMQEEFEVLGSGERFWKEGMFSKIFLH